MINYADASLFLQDSLDKQIHIVSEDNTINITNEDIVGESFTLTESLCSEENLIFGSCEPSCIKFTVKNTFPRMYKKWFNVTITLEGSETPFVVGTYRVWGEKPSSDRTTKEITAYDVLYNIFKHTYKRWYKNLWGNSDTMTIKQFRDAWFTRLQSTHPHISQETTTLINDNVVIKKSKKITKPSGKDIFNAICEINGVFGKIGRDGVFHYITLNDSNTTYAINNAQTIEVDYEDYTTSAIDRVEILDPEGEVLGYAGAAADEAENTYTIENNFMLKGLGNDEDAQDTATVLAETLYYDLRYVTFIPFDAEFKGNPCFETGDRISFTAHGSTKTSYILERTMRGIQSLHDDYIAEGEETYPERSNGFSQKIKDLKNDIGATDIALENTPRPSNGYDDPVDGTGRNGDFYIKHQGEIVPLTLSLYDSQHVDNVIFTDNNDVYIIDGIVHTCAELELVKIKIDGLHTGVDVTIKFSLKFPDGTTFYSRPESNLYCCFVNNPSVFPTPGWTGGGVWHEDLLLMDLYQDTDLHDYVCHFTATADTMYMIFRFGRLRDNQTVNLHVYDMTCRIGTIDVPSAKMYYNDNGKWRNIEYISSADESEEAGGSDWNGVNVNQTSNKLSLKPNVMRAWYKADPPQTTRNFSQFCVRYTGKPDTGVSIESYANHTWENQSLKADDENAFKIKSGGVGGSGKYCVYKITGLTNGTKYYFNFAVNFSDGTTFGNDTSKGLGLVFNTTGTISTDAWSGDPDTFDDTTKYYSMRRSTTKTYADFAFTASASTMYMCVVTADITSSAAVSLTLSEFVISKNERKYIREIYLYDYEKNVWLKYRPFGSVTGGGDEGGGSVVTITPTLQSGTKVADFSVDGEQGSLYAPNNSYNLPIASENTLGGIKVGQNLTIDNDGTLNAQAGGGGTSDYTNLTNKPSINSVTLSGNKTSSDLGMVITLTQAQYNALSQAEKEDLNKVYYITDSEGEITGLHFDWSYTTLPQTGDLNTIYAIPTSDPNMPYDFYAWDGTQYTQLAFTFDMSDYAQLADVYTKDDYMVINCAAKTVASHEVGVWDIQLSQSLSDNWMILGLEWGIGSNHYNGGGIQISGSALSYPYATFSSNGAYIYVRTYNQDSQSQSMWARVILMKVGGS